ncbi:MAG TPA: peptidoglycan-binding domain-containing protein, partial [Candidatus Omnitrophota bacterium]|nr:peptidoglycan-binding domain-containing protein [Candidatus Omnitrophota bacterium]
MSIVQMSDDERRRFLPHYPDDYFTLGAPVGPGQPNRREDVLKVETILGNLGRHDLDRTAGPLGWWGQAHETAVKGWQGDNGLKVDGVLKPGGPTIGSLRKVAGGLLGGFTPPSPAQVDKHHTRLHQGEAGLLNTRPARLSLPKPEAPLELDEQSQAFNADTARALTRTSVDGDVPSIYANFLKQAGTDGHATLFDLAEQIESSSGRDRADRVLHGIVGRLPGEGAKALLGGAPPAKRPLGVLAAELPDDDKVPLFRAAAGPKMQAMATAQASKPGSDDVLTVPASGPAEPGAQAPDPQKPVQTAWVGPAAQAVRTIGPYLLPLVGGAIQTMQGQQEKKPEGQQTTVADPEAGKPQALPGPNVTQPQPKPS